MQIVEAPTNHKKKKKKKLNATEIKLPKGFVDKQTINALIFHWCGICHITISLRYLVQLLANFYNKSNTPKCLNKKCCLQISL